jgi:hydrogenase maturation protein HypF
MQTSGSTILACGAWLKNAACLLSPEGVQWSAVHGDLSDPEACKALQACVDGWVQHNGARIDAVAHDLHPDFFSTRLAIQLSQQLGVPAIAVQHHHAHVAVVMAEHGVHEPVVGLALDGVGMGTDGQAWGGELLWVTPEDWQRLGHLSPLHLPGGDVAAREPWRMAAAALHALGRGTEIETTFAPLVGAPAATMVRRMLERGLNCPPTTSTGRWFDAAAAALGLSLRQSHEAEAAIALERLATDWQAAHGVEPVAHGIDTHAQQLDLRPLLARLLDSPPEQAGAAALWFHLALADALADWAAHTAQQRKVQTVGLSGGCFFNQLLKNRVIARLQAQGLRVLLPRQTSCGDAGLALGQAWVAAQQLHSTTKEPALCA